jgi:hypothetical protein
LYQLPQILAGDLDLLVKELQAAEQHKVNE